MYVMAEDRTSAERGRAVEAALANIEKKFGKGSIMRLGEREVSDIPAISTTSLSLDAAIGVGGESMDRAAKQNLICVGFPAWSIWLTMRAKAPIHPNI